MHAAFDFAKLLSAFGVPVALFIAIGNALWQSYLQRRQFKISLFDKRFPVYETLRRFLAFGMKKTEAECVAFLQETRSGKYLFGPAFDDFVNEVYRKANRLRSLNDQWKDGQVPDQCLFDELQAVEKWLTDAFNMAEKKFGSDVRLYKIASS
jgi:hypothetical protein